MRRSVFVVNDFRPLGATSRGCLVAYAVSVLPVVFVVTVLATMYAVRGDWGAALAMCALALPVAYTLWDVVSRVIVVRGEDGYLVE